LVCYSFFGEGPMGTFEGIEKALRDDG